MKNNLHLKSHLDVLFVTYIQINTIWLMNSILKKCKKKFSHYFQVLYWKDFVIQRTPSLYDSTGRGPTGGNGIFRSQIF